MSCDTIKFKVSQDPTTKNLKLEIYRPYGDNDDWMRVDAFNEMTTKELKCLTEYLVDLFKKKD
jgi:hypothetical protein